MMKRHPFVLLLILLASLIASPSRAQGPNHAALVVQFGDGSVISRCVAFNDGSITG
jgi:hypothetical protein